MCVSIDGGVCCRCAAWQRWRAAAGPPPSRAASAGAAAAPAPGQSPPSHITVTSYSGPPPSLYLLFVTCARGTRLYLQFIIF